MNTPVTEPAASTLTTPSDREVRIERVFDAPRELVWRALTEPSCWRSGGAAATSSSSSGWKSSAAATGASSSTPPRASTGSRGATAR
jgi:hypothetical protein